MEEPSTPDRDERFLSELNASGYPFQHAVVQKIKSIASAEELEWTVEPTEFPVSYGKWSTHIDVIAWYWRKAIALVGECKRANPAFSEWLFLRSPHTFDPRAHSGMWFEKLQPPTLRRPTVWVERIAVANRYGQTHIALEVKTRMKGDEKGQGRTLKEAITQAQIGANGLIHVLQNQFGQQIPSPYKPVILLPVVFTTAQLFTSDAALNIADLATGRIPQMTSDAAPWVWFEENVSPNLLHGVRRDQAESVFTLSDLLAHQHTRGMAIVNAEGIAAFLKAVPELFLEHIDR